MKLIEALERPFDEKHISWRVGATMKDKSKGIALAYLDARAVMRRLDDACGAFWQCRYPVQGLCEIGIKVDGEWLWRANGAGVTDIEAEKGQYSDSFKRAAVLWGVGRYLYNLPNEWVALKPAGKSYKLAETPKLPNWALPSYTPRMNKQVKADYVEAITQALDGCDDITMNQLKDELDESGESALLYVWKEFNSAQRGLIKDMIGG